VSQQAPPPSRKQTSGLIHAVPCPHCGKNNDFREIKNQHLLETGSKFSCDHCQRMYIVTLCQPTTLVGLRQVEGKRPAQQTAKPGTAISPRRGR